MRVRLSTRIEHARVIRRVSHIQVRRVINSGMWDSRGLYWILLTPKYGSAQCYYCHLMGSHFMNTFMRFLNALPPHESKISVLCLLTDQWLAKIYLCNGLLLDILCPGCNVPPVEIETRNILKDNSSICTCVHQEIN